MDKKKISKHFKDVDNKFNGQDISKVEIYYWMEDNVASRVLLNDSFDEKRIEAITDSGIQKILMRHLETYRGRVDERGKEIPADLLAFSSEGIEEMNKNIQVLNGGKHHQPILKVRTYEPKGNKFVVGQRGNKGNKFVEAAKGTNLYFAIYEDENKKRFYETVPLNVVIERQKQGLSPVPERNEKGDGLLFSLSPNDLVYVSKEEVGDLLEGRRFDHSVVEVDGIYKVVSFTGNRLYGVPSQVAKAIVDKVELTQLNKLEVTLDRKSLKESCAKLSIDRLGEIRGIASR